MPGARSETFAFRSWLAVVAVAVFALLRVTVLAFAILALTIAFVLAFEAMNTALEALVDLVSPERHALAKAAKDAAAGAVLIAALGALASVSSWCLPFWHIKGHSPKAWYSILCLSTDPLPGSPEPAPTP